MKAIRIKCVCVACKREFERSLTTVKRSSSPTLCRKCSMSRSRDPEKVKRANEKRRITNLQKYGAEYPVQREEIKDKMLVTLKRRGRMRGFENKETQCKIKKVIKDCNSVEKRRETSLEKYGADHYCKTEEFKERSREEYKKKTGYENPMHNPEVRQKIVNSVGRIGKARRYFYKNVYLDSSWELAYYIWLEETGKSFIYQPQTPIAYIGDDDNRPHFTYPDFLVDGVFYEIKGTQFFNEKGEPFNFYTKKSWRGKYEALIKSNVKILKFEDIKLHIKYVSDKYSSKYLGSFKISFKK